MGSNKEVIRTKNVQNKVKFLYKVLLANVAILAIFFRVILICVQMHFDFYTPVNF